MKRIFRQTFCLLVLQLALFTPRLAYSQSSASFDVEVNANNYQIIKSFALPGNRLGILVWDNTITNVYLWIYSSAGTQTANIDITSRINWPHTTHGAVELNAIATSNGNIFIAYSATSNSTGIQTYNARYVLLNDSGVEQTSGQLNNTDAAGEYVSQIILDKLSDGKIMAVWRRSANNNLLFRLFNQDGSAFANNVAFAGPGSLNSFVNNSIYTFKAAAGKNGNFMVSLYYYNGDMRGFAYDNNGNNAVSGGATSFAIDPTVINNYGNNALLALANGNFAASWWLSGTNYIKIIAADGSTIVDKQSMPYTYITNMLPVYTPGSEGYIVAESIRQAPGDMSNPYSTMWFHRFNQSGVFQNSSATTEGALIQPSYKFISGSAGGYAYLYSYYKSYSVMPFPMNMYMVSGDMDTKGFITEFSMSTLPVSLISYQATLLPDQKVQLSWKTASETNSAYFQIERSNDGRNFSIIGRVNAKGNSIIMSDYSFIDEKAINGNTYYRLKQFDIDGKSKDLGIKLVRTGTTIAASVYPNPVQGNKITIFTGNEPLPANYLLTDVQGRTIRSGVLQRSMEELDIQQLNNGVYFLHIGMKQVVKIKK